MTNETAMEWLSLIVGFFDHVVKVTPVFVTIAAFLGFFLREKLKTILARSLSVDIDTLRHEFAKDLAEHTSKLQRDVETYKIGLIAESERIKAIQDVKKAVALKAAEKRFNAISKLLDAHLGIDTEIAALVQRAQSNVPVVMNGFQEDHQAMGDRLREYGKATRQAQLFLEPALREKIMSVRQAAWNVLNLRLAVNSTPIPRKHSEIESLLIHSLELEKDLRKLLADFENA